MGTALRLTGCRRYRRRRCVRLRGRYAAQVAERVHELAGLDISSADGIRRTASAVRLRQLISADVGGGMLELYWLPSMEAVRTWPALHEITSQLLAETCAYRTPLPCLACMADADVVGQGGATAGRLRPALRRSGSIRGRAW